MNTEQIELLNIAKSKVGLYKSIVSLGFLDTPPSKVLDNYNDQLTQVWAIEASIRAKMSSPKPLDQEELLQDMQNLEAAVFTVSKYADQLAREGKELEKSFYNQREQIQNGFEVNNSEEEVVKAFRALAVALKAHWFNSEKAFRFSQYITGLAMRFEPNGVMLQPPQKLYLGFAKVDSASNLFYKAYIDQFLRLFSEMDNISLDQFHKKI